MDEMDRNSMEPAGDSDEGTDRQRRYGWRLPLVTALVAVPILLALGGARLACDAGVLEVALCGSTDAPIAMASGDIEISGGETVLAVADPGSPPVIVAREPTSLFPGQFLKFVVVSPDNRRVLYVTATSLGMTDATMWTVPRAGGVAKTHLKSLGDTFWVARPAWCQPAAGDPGRIAYIQKGPVGLDQAGLDRSGLELWVIDGDGGNDRRVLVGSPQNGLTPEQFYGDRPLSLRFMGGCRSLRYGEGDDRFVIDLDSGQARKPLTVSLPMAPPPTPVPTPGAAAPPGQPCVLKPYAQTDPRWGGNLMRTANSPIRSWGCALTSTAMVFNYYGVDTDPGRLNQCANELADLLYWDPVRVRCAVDRIPTATRWNDQASWADLEASLSKGRPVIVGLQGGPAGSHYLVATSGSGNSAENYRITDSWDGSTYKTLADYINPKKGYILKWLIVFEGPAPTCTPVVTAEAGLVSITSPQDGGVYNTPRTIRYSVNAPAGAQVQASHPDGATIGDEGPHTLTVTVTAGEQVVRKRVNFLIDLTAPTVTGAWQPVNASSVRLDLTASDEQTAVTEAHYRVDDGAWQPVNAATAESLGLAIKPIEVAGLTPGTHRIGYYAVDSAGNRSPESELTVVVAPPAVAIEIDGNPTPPRVTLEVVFPPEVMTRTVTIVNTTAEPVTLVLDRNTPATWLKVTNAKRKRGATLAPPPKPRTKKQRPERRPRAAAIVPPVRATAVPGHDGGLRAFTAQMTVTPTVSPLLPPRPTVDGVAALSSERIELLPGEEMLIELVLDEDQLFDDSQQEVLTLQLPRQGGGPPAVLTVQVRAVGAEVGVLPAGIESGPVITPIGVVSDRLIVVDPAGGTLIALRGTSGTAVPWRIRGGEQVAWLSVNPRMGTLPADGGPEVVTVTVQPPTAPVSLPMPVIVEIDIGDPPAATVPVTIIPPPPGTTIVSVPPVVGGGPAPAPGVTSPPGVTATPDPARPWTPTPTPDPNATATATPNPLAPRPAAPAITPTPTTSLPAGAVTSTPMPDPRATTPPTAALAPGVTPTSTPATGLPPGAPTSTPSPDPNAPAMPTSTPAPQANPGATATQLPGVVTSTPTSVIPSPGAVMATPTAPPAPPTPTPTDPPALAPTPTPTVPPSPTPTPTVSAPPTAAPPTAAPPTAAPPASAPPTPTRTPAPPAGAPPAGTATVPPPADQLDPEEAALLNLINQYRAENGLPPFTLHPNLSAAADWHSHDMARNNYIDHTDSTGRDPFKRMADFGFTANTDMGESLDAGRDTAAKVFESWKSDSYHNDNMLWPTFRSIGIGRAYSPNSTYKWYWTTTFGGE